MARGGCGQRRGGPTLLCGWSGYHHATPLQTIWRIGCYRLATGPTCTRRTWQGDTSSLRVDPCDWPLLGFCYKGKFFLDICPPLGLRSSAMCMQQTARSHCVHPRQEGLLLQGLLGQFWRGGAGRTLSK